MFLKLKKCLQLSVFLNCKSSIESTFRNNADIPQVITQLFIL